MQTRSRRYSRAQCVCCTTAGLLSNREGVAPTPFLSGSISQTSAGTAVWYAPPTGALGAAQAIALSFDFMLTNFAPVVVVITPTTGITPVFSYRINAGSTSTGTSFTLNAGDKLRFAVTELAAASGTITFTGFPQAFSISYSI